MPEFPKLLLQGPGKSERLLSAFVGKVVGWFGRVGGGGEVEGWLGFGTWGCGVGGLHEFQGLEGLGWMASC